jgi:hypothetical protein
MKLYICCHKVPGGRIAASFDFARFAQSLEARRGTALHLSPLSGGSPWASMWIHQPGNDWIVYRGSPACERDYQLIVHQAAHMLLSHHGVTVTGPMLGCLLFPEINDRLCELFPHNDINCAVATGTEERKALEVAREMFRHGQVPPDESFNDLAAA